MTAEAYATARQSLDDSRALSGLLLRSLSSLEAAHTVTIGDGVSTESVRQLRSLVEQVAEELDGTTGSNISFDLASVADLHEPEAQR